MTTILKSISGLAILIFSSTLMSMTPDNGGNSRDLKVHIIHDGEHLCISKSAFQAHSRKHIGKMDCGFAGYCTPESASFHRH